MNLKNRKLEFVLETYDGMFLTYNETNSFSTSANHRLGDVVIYDDREKANSDLYTLNSVCLRVRELVNNELIPLKKNVTDCGDFMTKKKQQQISLEDKISLLTEAVTTLYGGKNECVFEAYSKAENSDITDIIETGVFEERAKSKVRWFEFAILKLAHAIGSNPNCSIENVTKLWNMNILSFKRGLAEREPFLPQEDMWIENLMACNDRVIMMSLLQNCSVTITPKLLKKCKHLCDLALESSDNLNEYRYLLDLTHKRALEYVCNTYTDDI